MDIAKVISGIVVVGFSVFLIGLALVIALKPLLAERFFKYFASSAATHYVEQGVRLLVGASIVIFAYSMWYPDAFRVFGWLIVASTVGLLLIPWRWHHRFASRVMPPVYRHIKLLGLGAFLLGVFLLYGASHALTQTPSQLPVPKPTKGPNRSP